MDLLHFALKFDRNSLKNLIIVTMYFFITWYLSNIIKLIIAYLNELYDIRTNKNNLNFSFFIKNIWQYYIYNLLLYMLRNFVKMCCFRIEIKSNNNIKNPSAIIKIASNGIKQ